MYECTCIVQDREFEEHEDFCEKSTITKGEAVELITNGVRIAIEDYQFFLEEFEGKLTHDQVVEAAANQTNESICCYFGLGSCGSGGCKH